MNNVVLVKDYYQDHRFDNEVVINLINSLKNQLEKYILTANKELRSNKDKDLINSYSIFRLVAKKAVFNCNKIAQAPNSFTAWQIVNEIEIILSAMPDYFKEEFEDKYYEELSALRY